ncbi:MAG: sulfatase-like hydrolase/transferase [Cyclobacteriaceae bacterium]|nr:sulfatase-like hydrolase/transferase [Cyclobacteriaceae bacterium]
MSKNQFWRVSIVGNSYVALILSLMLVMVLYSLSRIVFFLFNIPFFQGMDANRFMIIAAGGLRFDLSATLYSNSLFILLMILPFTFRFSVWYKLALKWVFIVCNTIAFAANSADIIYYRFTLRRTTLSVFSQFENETNLERLFLRFLIDYWYAFFFFLLLIVLLVWGYSKIRFEGPQTKKPLMFYSLNVLAMLLALGLFIGGARGGFRESTRPITLSNAAAYAKEPKDVNLVLNTPFAMMRTAKANVIKKVYYYESQQELEKYFNPLKTPTDSSQFQNKNVVVIILESFSKEFVGAYNQSWDNNKYSGFTPFLDSLISHSRSFKYSMANGRKSIDAMPSVICSVPSIEVPYVLSHFSGNKVNSLPILLKEKGYYTAFFHGAPNGSMGFDAFANQSGFADYFGKEEYGNDNDFDGIWGIWDEKFLQYYSKKMNGFKQPFYTTLFTVSSHHPYQLPEEYQNKFKGGSLPIYRTIEYTDWALKLFFQSAAKTDWFKNTLFVLTADHASAEIQYPQYNTAWGYFSIPIIFYQPGLEDVGMKDELVQQVDILPSILGYLGYDQPYITFGRDVFNPSERPFAFNYLNNTYQFFQGNYLLQFDGQKSIALFDFKGDPFLKNNQVNALPDTVSEMQARLRALIQQYNNRMVDDNLTKEGSQLEVLSKKKD